MLRSVLLSLSVAFVGLGPQYAAAQVQQTQPEMAGLSALLDIDNLIDVMRIEGRDNAIGVDTDILNGQGGAAWLTAVDRVYDPSKLRHSFDAALDRELGSDPAVRQAMRTFFGSGLGKRIVGLEVAARRTLIDSAAEDSAKRLWDKALSDQEPRSAQIERFAQINDLIESNVMGALNSNFAFFKGLSTGGAFDAPMTEDEMLAQVWAQEGDIRADTADWLYPFLMLAYQPLSDAELDQYIAFSLTPEGKKINAAIFAAFDDVFVQLSRELGASAAQLMTGQDI